MPYRSTGNADMSKKEVSCRIDSGGIDSAVGSRASGSLSVVVARITSVPMSVGQCATSGNQRARLHVRITPVMMPCNLRFLQKR
jgi:hypothetical protein